MEQESTGKLTLKEKLGFVGLVVFAVAVIYLGFMQLGNSIKTPSAIFAFQHSSPIETQKTDDQLKEELKKKDTDKDGLSDYDELYIYQTSPYLADSDSDGIDDKTEIEQGTDPNCPKGQTCGIVALANPTAADFNTTTINSPIQFMPTADQMLIQTIFGGNPDPTKLRDFLLKQGMNKTTLDALSDSELLSLVNEAAFSTTTGSGTPVAPVTQVAAPTDLELLDPKNLRQLLREKGASEADLQKIDDKTLIDAAKQILNQQ